MSGPSSSRLRERWLPERSAVVTHRNSRAEAQATCRLRAAPQLCRYRRVCEPVVPFCACRVAGETTIITAEDCVLSEVVMHKREALSIGHDVVHVQSSNLFFSGRRTGGDPPGAGPGCPSAACRVTGRADLGERQPSELGGGARRAPGGSARADPLSFPHNPRQITPPRPAPWVLTAFGVRDAARVEVKDDLNVARA